jgi:acetyl-CoA carboxylase biotin carboxyl carrier protein
MAIDIKTLEKILILAKKYKLAELEVEDGKNKFKIKTSRAVVATPSSTFQYQVKSAQTEIVERPLPLSESAKKVDQISDDRYIKICSPFVGTFYRAPSPDSEPYVKEGQTIKKGDVLCIIEAMKLMNEIESEVSGKIVSILVENGQPVEFGEPLFLIDPL